MSRPRCNMKVYHIYINGAFASNSFGESATQAIAFFCKQMGMDTGRACKVGQCGARSDTCARNGYTGCYPCGSIHKCQGIAAVPTSMGIATAVQVM